MAEKPDKKGEEKGAPAPGAGHGEEKKAQGGGIGIMLKSTPVLMGVVMVLEAVLLFGAFKMFGGGPAASHGAELTTAEEGAEGGQGGDSHGGGSGGGGVVNPKKLVELSVLEFKAPNKLTGRTFVYDVSIYVALRAEFKDQVKAAIEERGATIRDRIRTIIAQSDPEKLGGGSEPGLETLRRQVKHQLDEVLGKEGLIEEVLVPRCIPYRADF